MSRSPSLAPQTIARLLLSTVPRLSCDDCFERIDRYAEAELSEPGATDRHMAVHLRGCPSCAEEAESLIDLLQAGGGPEPSPAAGT